MDDLDLDIDEIMLVTSMPTSGAGSNPASPSTLPPSPPIQFEGLAANVEPTITDPSGGQSTEVRRTGGRPPLPRSQSNRSKAWDHFTKDPTSDPNEPLCICDYCGVSLKCHSKTQGTSSLLNHLKRCPKYNRVKTKCEKGQSFLSFEASKSSDGSGIEKNMD
ncbi:hypothetical protein CJ030_MR7G016709 [Morella rubra]|uniref:BED-type domain-containing protein n=1 Tax=Morella rubra TaxID=262757 RepID=A0A6A1UXB7_9ROSI|nr:hypothetical protein CJ030_MR7G016709 [Morella rubra]